MGMEPLAVFAAASALFAYVRVARRKHLKSARPKFSTILFDMDGVLANVADSYVACDGSKATSVVLGVALLTPD